MTAPLIQDVLYQRLVDEGREDEEFALSVLAACEGDEALQRLLDDAAPPRRPPTSAVAAVVAPVSRAFLSEIEVRAFRGIGGLSPLPLQARPGVTLIVGRNGSGKSSFAEAAEVAMTGTSARWTTKKSKEWEKGWRNLHETQSPRIVVKLTQEGIGRSSIERTWADPGLLTSGASTLKVGTRAAVPLSSTGWGAALDQYRPFLTYSELGGLLEDGPGKIYQALLAGLGLDDYEAVRDRLAAAENARGKLGDTVRKAAADLAAQAQVLAASHADDARYAEVAALLQPKRVRNLDALERHATGLVADTRGRTLEAVTALDPPLSLAESNDIVGRLRGLVAETRQLGANAAGLAHRLAGLLREALAFREAAGEAPCPVCGSDRVLDGSWADTARERLREAEQAASAVGAVERELSAAVRRVHSLCTPVPGAVEDAVALGLAAALEVRSCWRTWRDGATISDAEGLAAHIERAAPALIDALQRLAGEAADETARRDLVWQPFAAALAQWVTAARQAERAKVAEKRLKDAKEWVAAAIDDERQGRFAPIRQQAIDFWNLISEHSNVRLLDIALTGQGKQQRVSLRVAVDGVEAPALGVMSQGELNAMTLSLFLPRVLLQGTPFGFVIVDDPVQAMDEARVDGLARVLTEVGRHRQVVVFTHDTRLPDAFDRLVLPHQCVQVVRAQNSTVAVRPLKGSIEQRLNDAGAVARTPDVPEEIAARVVPGFCRQALEAACADTLRSRLLAAGEPHAAVEDRLRDATLRELLLLLFFKDRHSQKDLAARLKHTGVQDAAAIIADCQTGAHEGFPGDLVEMVERTRTLCDALRKVS